MPDVHERTTNEEFRVRLIDPQVQPGTRIQGDAFREHTEIFGLRIRNHRSTVLAILTQGAKRGRVE